MKVGEYKIIKTKFVLHYVMRVNNLGRKVLQCTIYQYVLGKLR